MDFHNPHFPTMPYLGPVVKKTHIGCMAIWLALWLLACVPTDTARISLDERIYMDATIQWDGQGIKAVAQVYAEDSLGRRPYFLQDDIRLGGKTMEKSYQGHRGVYYQWQGPWQAAASILLAFQDLDGKEYEAEIPIPNPRLDGWPAEFRWTDLPEERFRTEGASLLCIDQQHKLQEWTPGMPAEDFRLDIGGMKVAKLFRRDSSYHLSGKLWLRYEVKSVSGWQECVWVE